MANAKVDVVGQDDIPIVLDLYNRIYRPTHDVQFFRRRFMGRYNVLMLIATLDESPVGFFAGFELKPSVFFAWAGVGLEGPPATPPERISAGTACPYRDERSFAIDLTAASVIRCLSRP
jgi:hypothetical protein